MMKLAIMGCVNNIYLKSSEKLTTILVTAILSENQFKTSRDKHNNVLYHLAWIFSGCPPIASDNDMRHMGVILDRGTCLAVYLIQRFLYFDRRTLQSFSQSDIITLWYLKKLLSTSLQVLDLYTKKINNYRNQQQQVITSYWGGCLSFTFFSWIQSTVWLGL